MTKTPLSPARLDPILFGTFGELRSAREAEDRRILDYVDSLDEARIASTITYRRVSSPQHHRGQIHALLTGLAGEAPELDLLYYQRLAEAKAA